MDDVIFKISIHVSGFVTFLELFVFCVQTSQKLWTALCGNTLFFFNDKKDCDVSWLNEIHKFELFFLKKQQTKNPKLFLINPLWLCVFYQYIEKLDLSGFISVTDETRQDRNLDAARFNLRLKGGNIKFTVREYVEYMQLVWFLSKEDALFLTFSSSSVTSLGPKCRSSWVLEGLYASCGWGLWYKPLSHFIEK